MGEVERLGVEHADRTWRDKYGNLWEPHVTISVTWGCGPLVREQSTAICGPCTEVGPADIRLPWAT
jgi:hypothetical protein